MSTRRSYRDSCGISRALDVVGERWALLVVRELLLGPRRFTDLRRGLPGIGPDMLSARLRELEAAGVVVRRTLDPAPAAKLYSLTARGRELEPVLLALGGWGSREPMPEAATPLSAAALAEALGVTYRPPPAAGRTLVVELELGAGEVLTVTAGPALTVARGPVAARDAALSTDSGTLATLLWHDGSLEAALDSGIARAGGERAALVQFLTRFALAATAPPASQ